MPNADGTPSKGELGYTAPNTGLLTVGQGGTTPPVAGYDPSQATASTAKSTGYDPSKFVMTPDQTVEGRAAKIAGDDSVLMQQARTRANQDAQAKGLLLSSIAVGAGQNAVLDKAIPIASQDAQAYNAAMTNTANAENTAKQFGAAGSNQAALANAQLGTDVSKVNAGMSNEAQALSAKAANDQTIARLDSSTRLMLGRLDSSTRLKLGTLDAQNRQLLQTNANAANMFQETVKNIAGISVDPTLTQAAKDAAVQSQINLLNEGLRTTAGVSSTVPAEISSLNLDQYFQTDTSPSGSSFASKQATSQLDSQIATAQAELKAAQDGTSVPVLTGKNASENRRPIWEAAIRDAQAKLTALQAQRASLGA